jgi:hypothetical protein
MSTAIVRQDHPFDNGYWARYDGKPRPVDAAGAAGWDACDGEFRLEIDALVKGGA